MKRMLGVLFFLACGLLASSVCHAAGEETVRHDWVGTINAQIPVAVWMETRDGLVAGEIVYTSTKAKKPIRLLGRVLNDGRLQVHELLPTGIVTGTLSGSITKGDFAGSWSGSDRISKKGSRFSLVEGKRYPVSLQRHAPLSGAFSWNFNPDDFAGTYSYAYGQYDASGELTLKSGENGIVEYRIEACTRAPHFNMAVIPQDIEAKMEKGRLQGNRILYQSRDGSCAFEILLFNNFAAVRYTGKNQCRNSFGMGAKVEGLFVRTR